MDALQQPQPMRPFSLLEILDRTFRIYRENFLTCIGIVAVITIPVSIVNFILSTSSLQQLGTINTRNPNSLSNFDSTTVCVSALIAIALAVVQAVLTNAPISYITSESYFGRKVSIGEAFQARQSRYSNLGCGFIAFYFILGAFAFAITLIGAICAPAFAVFGILIYIGIAAYSFLVPVLTLENVNTSLGVNRAWSLGKSRFWTAAGLLAAILVITEIISLSFGYLSGLLITQTLKSSSILTQTVADSVVTTLVNIFLVPLLPIGLTLLYYDTRLRVEGLDIALQSLERPDARPSDLPSPLPQGGLTGKDWRNMAIVVVATLVIVILFGAAFMSLVNSLLPGVNSRF